MVYMSKKAFMFQGVGKCDIQLLNRLNSKQLFLFSEYASIVYNETKLDLYDYLENHTRYLDIESNFASWLMTGILDIIMFRTLVDNKITPDYIVGYSLGLNNAMVCTGAITFRDSIHILNGIKDILINTKKELPECDMGVLIGLPYADVINIISTLNVQNEVLIASENTDNFIVISGFKKEIMEVLDFALSEGALRAKNLSVGCPFHTEIINKVADSYFEKIKNIKFQNTPIPIISAYNNKLINTPEDARFEQNINLLSKMNWKNTVLFLEQVGVTEFWDLSFNSALKKSSQLVDPYKSKFYTHKNISSIKKVI